MEAGFHSARLLQGPLAHSPCLLWYLLSYLWNCAVLLLSKYLSLKPVVLVSLDLPTTAAFHRDVCLEDTLQSI